MTYSCREFTDQKRENCLALVKKCGDQLIKCIFGSIKQDKHIFDHKV